MDFDKCIMAFTITVQSFIRESTKYFTSTPQNSQGYQNQEKWESEEEPKGNMASEGNLPFLMGSWNRKWD